VREQTRIKRGLINTAKWVSVESIMTLSLYP
jgi:hypothetical protein